MRVTANGKTFTFPDGTSQSDIGGAIDDYFAGNAQQAAPQGNGEPEQHAQVARAPQQPQQSANPISDAQSQLAASLADPSTFKTDDGGPSISENIQQAGKGLLQSLVNVANIPGSVVNTALDAVGVPKQDQVATIQLPESLRPTDRYAQMGAEIAPYLITGPEAVAAKTGELAGAVARGGAATVDKVADIIGTSMRENVVGSLAANASSGNQDNFGQQFGTDVALGGAAHAVAPVLGRAVNAVRARRAEQAAADAAEAAPTGAGNAPPEPEAAAATPPPEGTGDASEEAVRNAAMQTGGQAPRNPQELASTLDGLNIQPRAEVQQAADRLGMGDSLLPSHLSGNEQYQAVEQAIKSRPGSGLAVQENEAVSKLAKRASEMVDKVSDADSALDLNHAFNNEYNMRMNALEHRSNQLYKKVDEALPKSTQVEAPITAQHLETMADNVGGWQNLSKPEKDVFAAVNPGEDGVLTYERLNRVRKDIGNAIGKKQGVYKDEDTGVLRGLYARLSEDQKTILGDSGARRDFEVANNLVAMRKGMEDKMMSLRGKDLSGDATVKANQAVQQMTKGNNANFRRLFDGTDLKGQKGKPLIPTRAHRQQLLANAIGEQLSAGKRGTGFNPAGFSDWYENLQKNGGMQLIAKHMPGDFMRDLKDTYTVASAIRGAQSKAITTGRLNDFTRRFDRVNKQAQFIADHAQKAGAAIGAFAGGGFGAAGGALAGGKIAQIARQKGGEGASDAAEALLSSPAVQAEVRRMAGADPKNIEQAAERTQRVAERQPAYKRLLASLPPSERVTLSRIGLIAWANQNGDQQ